MRDSINNGKRRDLRKATLKCQSFTAYDLYDKIHGPQPGYYGESDWIKWYNARDQWILRQYGFAKCSMGPISAEFRRDQNRLQRSREKAALRQTFLSGEWEDFVLPGYRNNIRWLYW